MNLLISISLLLALALVILAVSRSLEWWERKTLKRSRELRAPDLWVAASAEDELPLTEGGAQR